MRQVKKKVKKKFFFNYDETGFNIINPPKTAIREKGSDCIKIDCNENIKAKFTFGLTISYGGAFLKPILITKGKTNRCLKKFDLNDEIIGTYTNKGWATENCILLVLEQIVLVTSDEESVLLMDQYSSHITDKIDEYAMMHNINIIYVPVGLTSKYQPLDVGINGILKIKAIKAYSNFVAANPDDIYTCAKCVHDFLIYRKEIKKRTIIKSFDCLKEIVK